MKESKESSRASGDMGRKLARRRQVLTTIALGTAAAAEVNSLLPNRWTKPIVESVILPAHAQLSPNGGDTFSCDAGSLTVSQGSTTDAHVAIIYDGESQCSLVAVVTGQGGDSGDPDEMLLIDGDGSPITDFDLNGPNYGTNWGTGPSSADNPAGSYSFNIQRVQPPNDGLTFQVQFDVSFSGNDMTVSNVQIMSL